MSARSSLHHFAIAGVVGFVMVGTALAGEIASDYLAAYRNTPEAHGLYEIREAARDFVKKENAKKKQEFRVMAPDIRIMVSRCVVRLSARWAHETQHYTPPGLETIHYDQRGVNVICRKSVSKHDYSWAVFVPVTSPQIDQEARRMREEIQRKIAAAK